jgi:spore maturation protein CgeB
MMTLAFFILLQISSELVVELAWSTSEKDLGVIVDCKLSFSEEICSRIKKANVVMGVIRRTFTYLDEKMFMCLYCSLVRPHLEYASSVWSPMWRKEVEAIEKVQRRATKQIPGFKQLTYISLVESGGG